MAKVMHRTVSAPAIGGDVGDQVAAQALDVSRRFRRIGRVGWVAKGLVYVLIGVLALKIALSAGGSGEEANTGGAVSAIARQPSGLVLVVVVGVGLALYVVWRLFTAFLPGDWTGKALLERLGYLVSAAIYLSLAIAIFQAVRVGRRDVAPQREDAMVHDWVGRVMDAAAGRWLVGLVGFVVAGVAVAFFQKALTRSFEEDLTFVDDETRHTLIVRLGQIGWASRAVSMALIAFFIVRAAVTFNSNEVGGIDGSMRQFTAFAWGRWVVAGVGVGFVSYGVFCVISAKFQRLHGPSND